MVAEDPAGWREVVAGRRPLIRGRFADAGPAALLVAALCAFSWQVPGGLAGANATQLLVDIAEPAMIAAAMGLVVIAGGIDLSLGATFALCDLAALILFRVEGAALPWAVCVTLAVGAGVGMLNGALVGMLRLPPFLTTLATMLIVRGVYDIASQAFAVSLADASNDSVAWQAMGTGFVLGLPANAAAALAVILIAHLLLVRTRFGAHVIAMGSSPMAARHAGVRSARLKIIVYAVASTIAALAGLLYAARQDTASSNLGAGMEIAALAAIVVGGLSLSGGRGTIPNAAIGAAVIGSLSGGLMRLNAPGSATFALLGGILLGGVALNGRARAFFGRDRDAASAASALEPSVPSSMISTSITFEEVQTDVPLLEVARGTKTFGAVLALDSVDFQIRAGEIHALAGANGAGKSTLMKVLAGDVRLTSGTLRVRGTESQFAAPADAIAAGIAMVYQETSLVPDVSVARNLLLGREPRMFREAGLETCAQELLAEWSADIDVRRRGESLSTAQRQIVEIVRAVSRRARVLILDEPTASLAPHERAALFRKLAIARERGHGVVLITHDLDEALRVADRITVLRDGRVVAMKPAASFARAEIVRLVAGPQQPDSAAPDRRADVIGDVVLEIADASPARQQTSPSLSLRAGEILGLAGRLGSGRTRIARTMAGLASRAATGMVTMRGMPVGLANPRAALSQGIVYVTEDRQREGMFGGLSAEANVALGAVASRRATARPLFRTRRAETAMAAPWLQRLNVVALLPRAEMVHFSGGNQQKILLARGFAQNPDVILLDEPTRGVDAGSVVALHATIRSFAREGKAVVVISSDPHELLALCDRIAVVSEGRLTQIFEPRAEDGRRLLDSALA